MIYLILSAKNKKRIFLMKTLFSAWRLSVNSVAAVRRIFKTLDSYKNYLYFIEEINIQKNLVTLRCTGTRAVIKLSIEEVVADSVIIEGLCPRQACILGGCYGRLMRFSADREKKLKNVTSMTFQLSNKRGRYVVQCQHRTGEIGYFNKKTKQAFIEHPLTIVNNAYIISEFDPTEACYLGILAGSSLERAIITGKEIAQAAKLIKKPPKLRIVS